MVTYNKRVVKYRAEVGTGRANCQFAPQPNVLQAWVEITPDRGAAIVRDLSQKKNAHEMGGLDAHYVFEALLSTRSLTETERARLNFRLRPMVMAAVAQIPGMTYQEGDS